MSATETVTVEIPKSVADAIRAAEAARDAGMARAEASELTDWNRDLIDQAIDAFAATGQRFSANDLRHLIDVPAQLMGARFSHAATNRRVIRHVGFVKSTKESTHAKNVNVYVGVPQTD